jgi:hypothetical protein
MVYHYKDSLELHGQGSFALTSAYCIHFAGILLDSEEDVKKTKIRRG